jgi:hypothetical protein
VDADEEAVRPNLRVASGLNEPFSAKERSTTGLRRANVDARDAMRLSAQPSYETHRKHVLDDGLSRRTRRTGSTCSMTGSSRRRLRGRAALLPSVLPRQRIATERCKISS